MRLPLGFGKKGYFSLAAIQACINALTTHASISRIHDTTRLLCSSEQEDENEDDPPPKEFSLFALLFS